MPNTVIVNVPGYEGEYEMDSSSGSFSHIEWRWIKQISGYMPLTIDKGWEGGDPDLMLAVALIAMHRAGKVEKRDVLQVVEELENAQVDGVAITMRFESDREEGEADPPTSDSPDDSSSDSGPDIAEPSEHSQESAPPSGTGAPDSDTGSDSVPLTLAR